MFGARLCVTCECVFVYLHDSSVQNHRLVSDLLQGQQEKREQGSAGLWVLKANLRISIKVEKGKTWKVTWLVHGVPKLRTALESKVKNVFHVKTPHEGLFLKKTHSYTMNENLELKFHL